MGGVYIERRRKFVFKKIGIPTNRELSDLLSRVYARVVKFITRLGCLKDDPEILTLFEEHPVYGETLAASTQYRIATGIRQGQCMRFVKGKPLETTIAGNILIKLDGFSLHAAVSIPSHRRDSLERSPVIIRINHVILSDKPRHPERSEGSHSSISMEILRFAQDDEN